MNAGHALMPAVLGMAAICALLAVIFLAAIVHIGRGKAEPADAGWGGSETPLFDQTVADLNIRPERPFSAGDEADVREALRLAADPRPTLRSVR
jgi:hypothetical protein